MGVWVEERLRTSGAKPVHYLWQFRNIRIREQVFACHATLGSQLKLKYGHRLILRNPVNVIVVNATLGSLSAPPL